MKQIHKTILIVAIAMIAAGSVGYFSGQRSVGAGPLAELQALTSLANRPAVCGLIQGNIDLLREYDDGSSEMRRAYEAAIAQYNKLKCNRK